MTRTISKLSSASVALEVAVQDVSSARAARQAGATRVELCSALSSTGGLTPSIGLIEQVVAEALPVHVLIRPRGGDFVYQEDETRIIMRDIRAALDAGAAGIVSGGLTADGKVDEDLLAMLVDASAGAHFTFHRALDAVEDQLSALDSIIAGGVDRVLTSGGAARCSEGVEAIAALVARASTSLEIQAGGGVTISDIPALMAVGVRGIHLSARRKVVSGLVGPGGGEATHDAADESLIAEAVAAIQRRSPRSQ